MLPIVLVIWCITNGIWYAIAFVDFVPSWLSTFAKAYLIFLYTPFALEKPLIILPLSVIVYRLIYKENFKEVRK